MKPSLSVSGRLTRGFTWIGLLGGLALIIFVSFDVEVMLEQQSSAVGWHGAGLEIAEHVVFPLVVLMVPMFIAARWVIRTSLAPLGAAATRMDMVSGTDRGFRLEIDDLPIEAQPFAGALNNLLKRLDDAAEQREAFAANVAHELRTPLAILMAELDKLGTSDAQRLKQDVAAMNRLVGQILLMAQVEAPPPSHDPISLEEIAMDVTTRFAPIATAKGRHIELEIEDPAMIAGIREMLAAAMGNLVENGLRVTPVGGVVVITAGPGARMSVRDGGPGLSATELAALSQRFARADHASAAGAGLGLAIVARIMDIHHGELTTHPHRKEIIMSFSKACDIDANRGAMDKVNIVRLASD